MLAAFLLVMGSGICGLLLAMRFAYCALFVSMSESNGLAITAFTLMLSGGALTLTAGRALQWW